MKTSIKSISHLVVLFILCSTNNVVAQSSSDFKKNKKTYCQIVKILKTSSYPTDTTAYLLGGYETLLQPYLDVDEINRTHSNIDSNAIFSEGLLYKILYISLLTLHSYSKNIPSAYIKIIPYFKSASLDKNWRKDSDANEVLQIENSIVVLIKNKKSFYQVLLINFNPSNHKLSSFTVMGTTDEAMGYIKSFYKN